MTIKSIIKLCLSLFITSTGIFLMNQTNLGLNPWWSFIIGFSQTTSLSITLAVQIIGVLCLFIAYLLGIKPGLGTLLDIVLVAYFIGFLEKLPLPNLMNGIVLQILVFILGLFVFSYGIFRTINLDLGVGPKEQLTIGLMKHLNKNMKQMKFVVEGSLFSMGILMGAPFGVGSLLCVLLSGHFLNVFMVRKQKTA